MSKVDLARYIDDIVEGLSRGNKLADVVRDTAMKTLNLTEDSWRMKNRPPGFGNNPGVRMSRLYEKFGDDVYDLPYNTPVNMYSPRAAHPDTVVKNIARSVRDNDDAIVDIFRASPRWAENIDTGDWVTPSLDAARTFQTRMERPGMGALEILRGQARAGDLYAGPYNSILEYGYAGKPILSATRVTGNVPEEAMRQALSGDRSAIEKVAKWYGLDKLAIAMMSNDMSAEDAMRAAGLLA